MKGQRNFIFYINMELELIQVDYYWVFYIFRHYFILSNPFEKARDFTKDRDN